MPDLLIFVWASPNSLRERIKKRGRKMEMDIAQKENSYLDELDVLYKKLRRMYPGRVLDINSEQLNPNKKKDQEKILDLIQERLGSS
jgi:deoxyadenosine/deoxycytidine kinase